MPPNVLYMPPKTRKLTDAQKKNVAARQNFKCANRPGDTPFDYICPFWNRGGDGSFDESGYDIDHIREWCETQDDSLENLQALCLCCHRVKTIRTRIRKAAITRKIREESKMDID